MKGTNDISDILIKGQQILLKNSRSFNPTERTGKSVKIIIKKSLQGNLLPFIKIQTLRTLKSPNESVFKYSILKT